MTKTWLLSTDGPALARDLTRTLAEVVLDAGGQLVLAAASPADLSAFADLPADRMRMVVLDGADPEAAVRTALEHFGRLDVVVSTPSAPAGTSADRYRGRLDAELLGAVALTRAALDVFRRQGAGSFLHLAAPAGMPGSAVDAAARRAVEGYFEALHAEVAADGVHVTVASPGAVPGDPVRTARVLADVVEMDHPPLRLVLGSDALRRATQVARGRVQELEVWADVSRSTDPAGASVRSLDRGLAAVLHLAVPAAS